MFKRNVQNLGLGVGANNVTFLPDNQNPLFSYFGAGIIPGLANRFRWRMTQPEQSWVNPALRVIGLPGVAVGQFIGQPLIDTRRGVNGI